MPMNIRQVVADNVYHHEDGIVPPDYPPPPGMPWDPEGSDPGDGPSINKPSPLQLGLILALISLAGTIMATVAFLSSDEVPGLDVANRQMKRLKEKVKRMGPWPEARKLARTLALSLFKKEDIAEYMSGRGASEDPGPRMSHAIIASITARPWGDDTSPYRPQVSKTKVKVAIRVFTVAVGLLGVAIKLFSLFSDWEDDPGMVELYTDTRDVVKSARHAGVSGALQKTQNMEIYRILRNTPGIGALLPRGGKPIIASAAPLHAIKAIVRSFFDPAVGGGEPSSLEDIVAACNDDAVRGKASMMTAPMVLKALEDMEKQGILSRLGEQWGWAGWVKGSAMAAVIAQYDWRADRTATIRD